MKQGSKRPKSITTKDDCRERLLQAVTDVKEAIGAFSITQAAKRYDVLKTTLYNRLQGRRDQVSYIRSKQKLTLKEKASLEKWVLQLQA